MRSVFACIAPPIVDKSDPVTDFDAALDIFHQDMIFFNDVLGLRAPTFDEARDKFVAVAEREYEDAFDPIAAFVQDTLQKGRRITDTQAVLRSFIMARGRPLEIYLESLGAPLDLGPGPGHS